MELEPFRFRFFDLKAKNFGFITLIFWLLLGGSQNFERLGLIRVEAAEAILDLNDVSGAYDNWFWLTP